MELGWSGGILVVAGDIDVATSAHFQLGLQIAALEDPGPITVDMADVTFFGSSGLHCLLQLVREDRQVVILRPSRIVRRVLELTGMADQVTIEDC